MKALISLLQFTTILPLGKPQDLVNFARHSYLYPCAGYIIGGLVALPVYFIADRTIAAACAVALFLLISGAHHFDGLLDLGDGMMAHGNREKRISALTDRNGWSRGYCCRDCSHPSVICRTAGIIDCHICHNYWRSLRQIFHGVSHRIRHAIQGRNA